MKEKVLITLGTIFFQFLKKKKIIEQLYTPLNINIEILWKKIIYIYIFFFKYKVFFNTHIEKYD